MLGRTLPRGRERERERTAEGETKALLCWLARFSVSLSLSLFLLALAPRALSTRRDCQSAGVPGFGQHPSPRCAGDARAPKSPENLINNRALCRHGLLRDGAQAWAEGDRRGPAWLVPPTLHGGTRASKGGSQGEITCGVRRAFHVSCAQLSAAAQASRGRTQPGAMKLVGL